MLYKGVFEMDLYELHSKIENYDRLKEDTDKKWDEIHELKPEDMEELEFQDLIQQARLNNKLIKSFDKQRPLECKHIIFMGANKEFLYDYASKIGGEHLSMLQNWLLEDLHNIRRKKHFAYAYDSYILDPRTITKEEYDRLIKKLDNKKEFTYEELDWFLLETDNTFITIDNTSGEMFVEEFKDRTIAERYLKGENLDKLREEECKYEVSIYETEEDYNKGEPFQHNVYSDLDGAKKELITTINFNHYFAGNIVNQENGNEEFSFYLEQEKGLYRYIFECTLESNDKKFEHQFLLVKEPNDLNTNLEIDLTGGFEFNCDFKVVEPKLVKVLDNLQDLFSFCYEHKIYIPKESMIFEGIVAGGENGLFINADLKPVDWMENIRNEEEALYR